MSKSDLIQLLGVVFDQYCIFQRQLLTIIFWWNHVDTSQLGSTYLSEFHLMLTTQLLCCFACVSVNKLVKPYQWLCKADCINSVLHACLAE